MLTGAPFSRAFSHVPMKEIKTAKTTKATIATGTRTIRGRLFMEILIQTQ